MPGLNRSHPPPSTADRYDFSVVHPHVPADRPDGLRVEVRTLRIELDLLREDLRVQARITVLTAACCGFLAMLGVFL